MNSFYAAIEKPIRPVVRLLRKHGHNTVCSCGHQMTVDIDLSTINEVDEIANLLVDNGYIGFGLEAWVGIPPDGFWVRRATVHLDRWNIT